MRELTRIYRLREAIREAFPLFSFLSRPNTGINSAKAKERAENTILDISRISSFLFKKIKIRGDINSDLG